MPGRLTQYSKVEFLADYFSAENKLPAEPSPNYNLAPTQNITAVRFNPKDNQREIVVLHWGLLPSWAKDSSMVSRMINARSETVDVKPSFKDAFKSKRCLIPIDGLYEWKKEGTRKQPYYIYRKDGKPMIFAGLWEYNDKTGKPAESGTIITTEPNDFMEPIHNRMPAIFEEDATDPWLDPNNHDYAGLKNMLVPCGSDILTCHPISTGVNSPKNNTPELIKPVKS